MESFGKQRREENERDHLLGFFSHHLSLDPYLIKLWNVSFIYLYLSRVFSICMIYNFLHLLNLINFQQIHKVATHSEEKSPKQPVDAEDQDDNEKEDPDRIFKVVVCGDGSSGKTSICSRFSHDHFDKTYHQTLGLDFFSRRLGLPGDVQVLLQVWDIGGQSIAGDMLEKYIYGANAALVVYDVTNSASFEDVSDWVNAIKRITKQQEKPPKLALVGNKTDLEHRRVIRIDKHNKFADEHGMCSFYVSAKTGDSVTLMFRQIAADLVGIALSKTDVESDIVIVEGEVTKEEVPTKRKTIDQSKNTAVCSIQ